VIIPFILGKNLEMYYIVYLSTANWLMGEGELDSILEVSRHNNTKNDITGLLVYADGSIIQLLEGEKETVLSTYRKILKDPRHSSAIKLIEGEISERNFPQWSMGFETISKSKISNLTGYASLKSPEFEKSIDLNKKHPAIVILRSFLKNNIFKNDF